MPLPPSPFSLTSNPFHLLEVSSRSDKALIAEAYEHALTEGRVDEYSLIRAQQALMASKPRLTAELSWFVGVPPAQVKRIMELLLGEDPTEALPSLEELEGLPQANLAAHFCAMWPGNFTALHTLVEAYTSISTPILTTTINSERTLGGFPSVSDALVTETLTILREQHVKAGLLALESLEHPGKTMTKIVEEFGINESGAREFVDALARAYDTWSVKVLAPIETSIQEACSKLQSNPLDSEAVETIINGLTEWDGYSQPLQLMEASRGLDESRSRELYKALRALCISLSNEHNQPRIALRISQAVLSTFPELPSVLKQVTTDVETLNEIVEFEAIGPLFTLVEQVKADHAAFCRSLASGVFHRNTTGLAGQIYRCFEETIRQTAGTPREAVPWNMLRGIALALNNESNAHQESLGVLKAMLNWQPDTPPSQILDLLKVDIRTVEKNLLSKELGSAIENKRLSQARRLTDQLLALTDDQGERKELQEARDALSRRVTERWTQVAIWGGLILFMLWLGSGSKESRPRHQSSPEVPIPKTDPSVLSRTELKDCLLQQSKLEVMRSAIETNNQVDLFNKEVDAWGEKCMDRKYRERDFQSLQVELAGQQATIAREVEEYLSANR